MTINLRLSPDQFGTLRNAMDQAIDSSIAAAADALKKHNLTRHHELVASAKRFENIKHILDVQFDHYQEV